MTSLARWFNAQHPSTVERYNDPSMSASLPETVDRFEITLNDDHGAQYIETHQLSIPPVQCLDASELAFLARLASRARMLSEDEYLQGELVVESVVRKAQMLLMCAHDGLEEKGLDGVGELFAAPVQLEEDSDGNFSVHGRVVQADTLTDINEIDVRARYMELTPQWMDDGRGGIPWTPWTYPAPGQDTAGGAGESSPDSHPVAEPSAACNSTTRAGAGVSETAPPSLQATAAGAGMKRVASWTEDKFTAMPTRTHFPPPSEINHLLSEDGGVCAAALAAAPAPAVPLDTAPSAPAPAPATPVTDPAIARLAQQPAVVPALAAAGDVAVAEESAGLVAKLGDPTIKADRVAAGGTPHEPHSSARSPTANRHVFSVKPAIVASAAVKEPGEVAAQEEAAAVAMETAAEAREEEGDAGEDRIWVQPCVGALNAADALVADSIDDVSVSSSGADGWRETLESPVACTPSTAPTHMPPSAVHGRWPLDVEGALPGGEKECVIGPVVKGILVRQDDGTRSAVSQICLERSPPLLLMHLNRFQHTAVGSRKRQAHVAFPFHLFIHPHVAAPMPGGKAATGPRPAVRYRLKAVLVHVGPRQETGHNVCYVWRPTAFVEAAVRVLKWVPPRPSAPISIPSRCQAGVRRCDSAGTPGSLSQLGGSLTNQTSSAGSAGRLATSVLAAREGASLQSCQSSGCFSMHSSWPSISAGGSRLSSKVALGGVEGENDAGHLVGFAGASNDLLGVEEATVDWEELADEPVPMRTLSSSGLGGACEAHSSSLRQGTETRSGSGRGSAGESVSIAAGTEMDDVPPVGDLLAQESLEDVGVWVKCDDESVMTVPWETVARVQAYMLMYEQV
jgi:hypothetical protein